MPHLYLFLGSEYVGLVWIGGYEEVGDESVYRWTSGKRTQNVLNFLMK